MTDLIAQTATAQAIGARDRQEDAVVAYSSEDGGPALAILSDGMGGHDDGDLASRIIVSEMFSEVFIAAARIGSFCHNAPQVFQAALKCANHRLYQHIKAGRLHKHTGGTLVCATVLQGQLRWLSVGDSCLHVFRRGGLKHLNEKHSVAAQLDRMVDDNLIDAKTAQSHPDRHCLTSAVTGNKIPKVDCPDSGYDLQPDDIVVLASDGLDVLDADEICNLIDQNRTQSSASIARRLMQAVRAKNAPDQDNSSVIVIKIQREEDKQAGNLTKLWQNVGQMATQARVRANPTRLRT